MAGRKTRSTIDSATLERFVANIKDLLHEKGWKDTDLAKKAQLSQPTVSNLLQRYQGTGFDTMDDIARALGVDIADLFAPPRIVRMSNKNAPVSSAVTHLSYSVSQPDVALGDTSARQGEPITTDEIGGEQQHEIQDVVGSAISSLTPAEARLLQHLGLIVWRVGTAALVSSANERAAGTERDRIQGDHPSRRSTDADGGRVK